MKKEGMILAKLCHAHPPWSFKKKYPLLFFRLLLCRKERQRRGSPRTGKPTIERSDHTILIDPTRVGMLTKTYHMCFSLRATFSMSSSLSGGRHSSIAFITEGPNPKNKSLKRLDLSDLTIVSLEARST